MSAASAVVHDCRRRAECAPADFTAVRKTDFQPLVYVPHKTQSFLFARLMVRTAGGHGGARAGAFAPSSGRSIRDIPIVDMMTMDEQLARQRNDMKVIGDDVRDLRGRSRSCSRRWGFTRSRHTLSFSERRKSASAWRSALRRRRSGGCSSNDCFYLASVSRSASRAPSAWHAQRGILFGIGPYDPVTLAGTARCCPSLPCWRVSSPRAGRPASTR